MDKLIAQSGQSINKQPAIKNKKGITLTVVGAVFFMVLVFLLFLNKLFNQPQQNATLFSIEGVRVLNEPRPLTPALFIDQNNAEFNSQEFRGHWNLVFFGFTHCPHICPMTLNEINRAYKRLPENIQQQTQVYLVTVDPERDSPTKLADYIANFNPNFAGLTGEFVTLKTFAESLYVPFFKIREDALAPVDEHAHHQSHNSQPSYDINHGSQVVIINPNGDYYGYYFSPVTADAIANTLPGIIDNYSKR